MSIPNGSTFKPKNLLTNREATTNTEKLLYLKSRQLFQRTSACSTVSLGFKYSNLVPYAVSILVIVHQYRTRGNNGLKSGGWELTCDYLRGFDETYITTTPINYNILLFLL